VRLLDEFQYYGQVNGILAIHGHFDVIIVFEQVVYEFLYVYARNKAISTVLLLVLLVDCLPNNNPQFDALIMLSNRFFQAVFVNETVEHFLNEITTEILY